MKPENLHLVMDDGERRIPLSELSEEALDILMEIKEEFGKDFEEGTVMREKQRRWREEHGIAPKSAHR